MGYCMFVFGSYCGTVYLCKFAMNIRENHKIIGSKITTIYKCIERLNYCIACLYRSSYVAFDLEGCYTISVRCKSQLSWVSCNTG